MGFFFLFYFLHNGTDLKNTERAKKKTNFNLQSNVKKKKNVTKLKTQYCSYSFVVVFMIFCFCLCGSYFIYCTYLPFTHVFVVVVMNIIYNEYESDWITTENKNK